MSSNSDDFLGATGQFPEPKISEDDDGEIQFAIGIQDDKVVFDFGTSVSWLAMSPQQAVDLASMIIKHARAAAKKNGETITIAL